jgi:hypothetical protein
MRISRRTALIGTASLLLSRRVSAADRENAVFWTVIPPGRRGAVLFGYIRIAAAVVPDIVKDGDSLVGASQRVVIDMPQRAVGPAIHLPDPARGETKPILQAVSPQIADRLRKFLATTPFASMVDRMTGLSVTWLLMGEGQHNENGLPGSAGTSLPTVGGTIFDYARSLGKPIDQLLSDAEIRSAWRPPDMAALENRAARDAIPYMLDLRDRVGPIGGYLDELYRQRKGEDIERVTTDMARHGVFSPSQFLQSDRVRDLLFERAMSMLTQEADEQRFMFFPLGILTGPPGLLAALKRKGAVVAPRA